MKERESHSLRGAAKLSLLNNDDFKPIPHRFVAENSVVNRNGISHGKLISDAMLKSLIDFSSDIITMLDEKGTILYQSMSIEKILGYKMDELVSKNAFGFIHKDDVKLVQARFFEGINNPGKPITVKYRFRNKEGNYVFLESVATKFDNTPQTGMIVVNTRDITERINAEINIKRLSTAVEQSSNTVVITDLDGKVEYVNKKFEDLSGYSTDEVIGKKPFIP